jgi:hypothetical protein
MVKVTNSPASSPASSPAWAITGAGGGGGESGLTTWEERVAASGDDGYWDDIMNFDNTSATTRVSYDDVMFTQENSFFRFTPVDVPQGSTISEATLELIISSGASYSFDMEVRADDADDTTQYTDGGDASFATDGLITVTWTGSGSWSADEVVQSPDIKTVIQEITDRGGWSSGNALTLRVYYMGDNGQEESYSFKTYDSSSAVAAKLTIKYS